MNNLITNSMYDVIIVGTGAAGLFTALNLPEDFKILMLCKENIKDSDSYLAQGGISCLLNDDDFDDYYKDTMNAGHDENDPQAVREMIIKSKKIIDKLITYGVNFDRNKSQQLMYTKEGGHKVARILHCKDETGKEIVNKLIAQVYKRNNISVLEHTFLFDLLTYQNICYGVVAMNNDGQVVKYQAKSVVLATGGLGGLFKRSTNFVHITGDAIAIALRKKIEVKNINYIQIHPTVLYTKSTGRKFLISESARGEGAVLLNKNKERFTDELKARDVVSEAILRQMQKDDSSYVYLSFEKISKDEILGHFPHIYKMCLEEGYDILKEAIPISPAQHYLMGGIKTDTFGQSSMKNLYAVGETACNGVHGANRLASNSLLESLVFAQNAAQKICTSYEDNYPHIPPAIDKICSCKISEIKDYNANIIWDEIKRKDPRFYDKWCNA